jgi:hypothetical protein
MQCCFCGKVVEPDEEAIEEGWYPDFWHHEVQYQGPICPDCQKEHLETDEDGEFILKVGHPLPSAADPLANPMEASPGIRPKFSLGQVVATPAALEAISAAGQTPDFFVDRHIQGNWGEICGEDKLLNDLAVTSGDRILSAFRTLLNVRLWIITEAADDQGNRAATTILLPEEY